jgi:hypothetical protein
VDSRRLRPPEDDFPEASPAAAAHPNGRKPPRSVALEGRIEGAVGDNLGAAIDEISHAEGVIDGTLAEGYYGDDRVGTKRPFLDDYLHYAAVNGIRWAAGRHIDDSPSPAGPAVEPAHSAVAQDSPAAT